MTAFAATAVAVPVQAQPCDPAYGCPPPPPPPPPETRPGVQVRPSQGPAGRTVGVEACGYQAEDAGKVGSITFDGTVVAQVRLDDDGCLVPGEGSNGLSNSFVVPQVPPGEHDVCAVFPGEATACTTFQVTSGGAGGGRNATAVLGAEVERGAPAADVSSERARSGPGSLARTGAAIGSAVALGLALVAGGRLLARRADRDRRQADR